VRLMNEKAESLGLMRTYFLNPTGLDISSEVGGAYGTARDVAKLLAYATKHHYDIFGITTLDSHTFVTTDGTHHIGTNTNTYASSTTRLLASKTGYTDLAGGNLAVVFDVGLGHPVVAVVLGASKEGRFTDMQNIISATYTYYGARGN
jgi:D-alanyl-D-alanine carboxypeptidase